MGKKKTIQFRTFSLKKPTEITWVNGDYAAVIKQIGMKTQNQKRQVIFSNTRELYKT